MGAAQVPLTALFLTGIAGRRAACPTEPSQQASAFGMSLAVTGHQAGTTKPIFSQGYDNFSSFRFAIFHILRFGLDVAVLADTFSG